MTGASRPPGALLRALRPGGGPDHDVTPRPTARALVITVVAIGLLALVLHLVPAVDTVDDAFITYRYAHNLATGRGLVYNPGAPVVGTSTPLWAAALAAGERLGVPPEAAAPVLAGVSGALLAALVVWAASIAGAGVPVAAAAGLLVATDPLIVRVERGGMEASAFSAWAVAVLLAMELRPRRRWARVGLGLAAGLSVALRPEGLLLVACLAAWSLAGGRRLEIVTALTTVLTGVAWLWAFTGSPLPQSLLAKLAVYPHAGGPATTAYLFAADAVMFLFHSRVAPWLAVLVGAAVAVLLGAAARARKGRWLALFTLAYAGAYIAASPNLFLWYHVPLAAGVVVAAAAGLSRLSRAGARRGALPAAAAMVAVAVFGTTGFLAREPGTGRIGIALEPSLREARYEAAATALRRMGAGPGTVVAAPEIGVIGYRLADVPVLDCLGLVSPRAVPFARRVGRGQVSAELVAALRPAFLVVPDAFAGDLRAHPGALRGYRQVISLPGGPRLGRTIHVLSRRDGG